MTGEPVLTAVVIAMIPILGGAVTALANDQTLAGVITAIGAVLLGLGGVLARNRVSTEATVEAAKLEAYDKGRVAGASASA